MECSAEPTESVVPRAVKRAGRGDPRAAEDAAWSCDEDQGVEAAKSGIYGAAAAISVVVSVGRG